MSLKIIRNDITKMNTQAIVNTANDNPTVGSGCDYAIYTAAGFDELLAYRQEHIGFVPEGDAFITPGFNLQAEYIIHAVSPLFEGGDKGEEEKLRGCYSKSLAIAKEYGIKSISFPLISTGSFGYPKEEGLRIALDEIYEFLEGYEMDVYVVVFGEEATDLGKKHYPDLKSYIDENYVNEQELREYGFQDLLDESDSSSMAMSYSYKPKETRLMSRAISDVPIKPATNRRIKYDELLFEKASVKNSDENISLFNEDFVGGYDEAIEKIQRDLRERYDHLQDTFSEYLLYLIERQGMTNSQVYKNAIVNKKTFAKIKADPFYHPQKITALCLCVGAKLSLDDTKDLLARAGYALSPSDMQDIIFSYFIENKIYDMVELDLQLEKYGFDCVIK